jgi:Domain of unknown function (DUF6883)
MGDRSTQRLPNADRAIAEERRVREYLLNLEHTYGGPKARFFMARGFASETWERLQASLIIQGRMNTVTRSIDTEWGTRYTVECSCPTPDGRNPCIRTLWQMEGDAPRLLTATPL